VSFTSEGKITGAEDTTESEPVTLMSKGIDAESESTKSATVDTVASSVDPFAARKWLAAPLAAAVCQFLVNHTESLLTTARSARSLVKLRELGAKKKQKKRDLCRLTVEGEATSC
jgi:hypothetical protein